MKINVIENIDNKKSLTIQEHLKSEQWYKPFQLTQPNTWLRLIKLNDNGRFVVINIITGEENLIIRSRCDTYIGVVGEIEEVNIKKIWEVKQ